MPDAFPSPSLDGTGPTDLDDLAVGIVELAVTEGLRFPGPPEDFCDPLVRLLGLMLRDGVDYPAETVRQPDGSFLMFRRLPNA